MQIYKSIHFIIRELIIIFLLFTAIPAAHSQTTGTRQYGLTGDANLKAVLDLQPYSVGIVGFDDRYEGVIGTPRLFDSLITAFLNVKGQDYYIQLKSDIDVFNNSLIFVHPRSGGMNQIPSDMVTEVVFNKNDKELKYRTFNGKSLDRDLREKEFCQILLEAPVTFLKLPVKKLVDANFKGAYSPDRRYDEFKTFYRYYVMDTDGAFHQVQLSKKSLQKVFPESKSLIDEGFRKAVTGSEEETVISILQKL